MHKRRGIIAIGNLLVDQSLRCTAYPQESMLAQITGSEKSCGGGCTNVLFDLARLDPTLPLSLCGVIGGDELGEFILEQAARHHVDSSRVRISPQDTTSFTYVMVNNLNGNRTFFHSMGANHQLGANDFAQLNCTARIAHVAYLLLLPSLEQPDDACKTTGARALAALQEQGFAVSLDLVSAPDTPRYQQWVRPVLPWVDYLIINDEEALSLSQRQDDDHIAAAHDLLAMGVRQVVCIHYPQGAIAVNALGETISVTAYHVAPSQVVSTLGAGDAFCAGVLYGIHEAWPLEKALRLGCASAHFNLFSVSATNGARPVKELHDFMQQKECLL
ncbi:carbohydrate kinase family protein [Yokenella regensburgei]|uniref:carbohydrate kinase family protein n=1 Tax=Yokenella regensburgei TaxID=158877 RepID=UPI003ED89306